MPPTALLSESSTLPAQIGGQARPAPVPGMGLVVLALFLWTLFAGMALSRGPAMGDHEVIVAQIARQSLADHSWLVPRYLDTPFLMKPPLAPWLVGGAASLFPADSAARRVNDFSARLPSAIATLLTVVVVWRLGASMFGTRLGWISAFVYMTSVGALLYAFNATAEAVLTLFCTWAYAEFWWSRKASGTRRILHQIGFYVALALAMLAKGPMPLAVVCLPLAVYWWLERPTRRAILRGRRRVPDTMRDSLRDSARRLKMAVSDLGLWWGVPLFLLIFLPWFFLVARREPYLWKLWNYEYLDRLQGNYPGVRSGEYFYYIPIALGLAIPWALSAPEALIAPFRRVYRPYLRPLVFAWYWAIPTLLISSLMSFKKSYYILPAMPAFALLLTPVLHRYFFVRGLSEEEKLVRRDPKAAARIMAAVILILGVAGVVAGCLTARNMYHEVWHGSVAWGTPLIAMAAVVGFAWSARLYLHGHRVMSFVSVGGIGAATFVLAWCLLGPRLGDIDDPMELVRRLDSSGVPRDARLYWASNRPDGRVVFYGGRNLVQLIDPYKLVAEQRGDESGDDLREMMAGKICDILKGRQVVYFVFQRGDFETLMRWFDPPARELFSIDRGKSGNGKDDWLVVTNEGVEPIRASSAPAAAS